MVKSLCVAAAVLLVAMAGGRVQAEPAATPKRALVGMDGLLGTLSLGGGKGPVKVDADAMEFDYRTRVLTCRGNVNVAQADMTLRSDVLRVTIDPDNPQRPRQVVAEGGVQINKGARRATGGRAVFDDAARTVTLSDQATLRDGPNEVAGERVVVYLDEERSVVEGGQDRVRAVLHPKEDAIAGDAGRADEP